MYKAPALALFSMTFYFFFFNSIIETHGHFTTPKFKLQKTKDRKTSDKKKP